MPFASLFFEFQFQLFLLLHFRFCNAYALLLTLSVFSRVPREYYPQNIMFDKRIHRGNTYAAMVIPAGTSHDTMITEKRQT